MGNDEVMRKGGVGRRTCGTERGKGVGEEAQQGTRAAAEDEEGREH